MYDGVIYTPLKKSSDFAKALRNIEFAILREQNKAGLYHWAFLGYN